MAKKSSSCIVILLIVGQIILYKLKMKVGKIILCRLKMKIEIRSQNVFFRHHMAFSEG